MSNDDPQNSRKIVVTPEILEPDENISDSGESQTGRTRRFQTGVWNVSSYYNNAGCLAPFITFILFLICTGQFGLLAGIGFCVFHIIIAAMGTIAAAKRLMYGLNFNIWSWRLCNWTISFLLVYWLAGGLQ